LGIERPVPFVFSHFLLYEFSTWPARECINSDSRMVYGFNHRWRTK
jgi:hypothetical protein